MATAITCWPLSKLGKKRRSRSLAFVIVGSRGDWGVGITGAAHPHNFRVVLKNVAGGQALLNLAFAGAVQSLRRPGFFRLPEEIIALLPVHARVMPVPVRLIISPACRLRMPVAMVPMAIAPARRWLVPPILAITVSRAALPLAVVILVGPGSVPFSSLNRGRQEENRGQHA
jgi:hypothetical protein